MHAILILTIAHKCLTFATPRIVFIMVARKLKHMFFYIFNLLRMLCTFQFPVKGIGIMDLALTADFGLVPIWCTVIEFTKNLKKLTQYYITTQMELCRSHYESHYQLRHIQHPIVVVSSIFLLPVQHMNLIQMNNN